MKSIFLLGSTTEPTKFKELQNIFKKSGYSVKTSLFVMECFINKFGRIPSEKEQEKENIKAMLDCNFYCFVEDSEQDFIDTYTKVANENKILPIKFYYTDHNW
jgi:hypothetical protein